MANKQIDMRKVKQIFKLHGEGGSKRRISSRLGLSRNTVTKYIAFFKRYQLANYEVSAMTLEEVHRLFNSDQRPKSQQLLTLEKYFPYFDKELRKTEVTGQLPWQENYARPPDGFKVSQFKYRYNEWTKEVSPVMHFTHKAGDQLFIDYTGKKLTIVDRHTGELQDLEVFVCVLGSSQYTYVEARASQKKEAIQPLATDRRTIFLKLLIYFKALLWLQSLTDFIKYSKRVMNFRSTSWTGISSRLYSLRINSAIWFLVVK